MTDESHDDDKLDLSALDPTRDALRFERMVRAVAAKAAQQRRPADPFGEVLRWWRPALALAASLALVLWAPSLLGASSTSTSTAQSAAAANSDPGTTLLAWASGEGPSTAGEVLAAFGRTP